MPLHDDSLTTRRFVRYTAFVGILYVVIRIIFYRQIQHSQLFTLPILDSEFYHIWAVSLVSGLGNIPGPFWLSPLYSFFIAGLFKLSGTHSIHLVVIAQMILSAGTLVMITLMTRRLFGSAVAIASAVLAAIYAPWLYYDGVMLSASLILFLNSIALFLLVTRTDFASVTPAGTRSFRLDAVWIPIGLLIGLSALARPSVLLFAACLLGWLVLRHRASWIRQTGLLFGSILIVLLPVLVRNYQVSGSWILTTTSGGVNFYIGNRHGASGMYDEMPFIRSFDPQREAEGFRVEASNRVHRNLTINQASRFWGLQAVKEIVKDPTDWIRLLIKKAWLTIQREEIANNLSFRGVAGYSNILSVLPVRWGLLFPLAAAGAIAGWRRRKELRLLWIYTTCYLFTNLIFFSASEYRFPLLAVLLPAAGCFFVEMWRVFQSKDFRRLLVLSGSYVAAMVVCNFPSREIAFATTPRADYYNMATVANDRGQILDAVPLFARALAVDPTYQEARLGLANALWKLGNFDDARKEFAMAGVSAPDSISGAPLNAFLENLYVYTEDGDYAEALAFMDSVYPANRDAPVQIWVNRAMVEAGLMHWDKADDALHKAMIKDPESPEWPYRAGYMALLHHDSTRADSFYHVAVERYPAYAPARLGIARLALSRRDSAEARNQLEEMRHIRIPDDSVRTQIRWLANELGEVFEFKR
jgi:tetratricopeptide (TPR) repeat protein